MKKVAVYLNSAPEQGGAFQYASVLLQALSGLPEDRYDLRCFYVQDGWAPYLEKSGITGEPIRRITGFRRLRNRIMRRLNRSRRKAYTDANVRIAEWGPDILVITQPDYFLLPRSCKQIAPILDLMHIYERRFPEVGSPGEIRSRDRVYSGMAANCAAIIVDAALGGEHVLANYVARPDQIRVLHLAAPESLLQIEPQRPERENLPEKYMFYPAQFWEHKNHVRLVEAMAAARKECPDLCFVFSGTTRYSGYPLFEQAVDRCGVRDAVTVLGYVSEGELSWLYRNARCLFMPTFFGPTNIPPLEAQALGCPVAISGTYAMPEQSGDAALYFNPESVSEMTAVMLRLWRDDALCEDLRRKGLERHKSWNAATMREQFLSYVMEL